MLCNARPRIVLSDESRASELHDELVQTGQVDDAASDLRLRIERSTVLGHYGLYALQKDLRIRLDVRHLPLHHIRLHARLALWRARHLSRLVPLLGGHVACCQIPELLLLRLQAHGVLSLGLLLLKLEILRQLYRLCGLNGELATGIWIKGLAHGGALGEVHRRHLGRMGILRRGGRLHALWWHLARAKVLILHGWRRCVCEALLEAELGLLRWCLGTRHGRAGRVALLGNRRHGIRARAVHLVAGNGAGIDEARRVVHAVLGRLEVHGARSPRGCGGSERRG